MTTQSPNGQEKNYVVDALSRLPVYEEITEDPVEEDIINMIMSDGVPSITASELKITVTAAELPSERKWSQLKLEDPRPHKYRQMSGYNDHVRNMMTNYCSKSSHNIALRYLYPKADVQTAAEDHHYLKQPFTEYMVDTALKVSGESAKDIEAATKDKSRSPGWHTERNWRLTASRFGEVTKITNRRNKKLCKPIVSTKILSCKPVIHGKQYEKRALSKFESLYNIKTKKAGLFVSCSEPYRGATPDAIIDADNLVEVKCLYAGRNGHIKPGKHFPYLH
ncbi:uncharacterized protein [Haliotis cracherodii]|uniref:uncharacterized protein n=1 Tax=Haliotis cracherodii TaxID=6455 RepID=UPI0039EB5FA4